MKFLFLLFLVFLIPSTLFAEDDFRIYKKPLLAGVEIAQTDTHTELLYKGRVIKKYVNTEFAIELLPHGPDEDPDCYNSLTKEIPSTRAQNIIGKDYLRSCLVLQTKLLRNRYILLSGPAIDGNRVSVYDIKMKKFSHAVANNVIDMKVGLHGEIFFFTRNLGKSCQRSIVLYKNAITQKFFDECSLKDKGIPYIEIHSFRLFPKKIIIDYTPYKTEASGNIVPDTAKRAKINLPF